MSVVKVTFPHMGNMYIVLRGLLGKLGLEVIVPPPSSKRTLSLGAQHGPEFACLPLKINLGNFMESAELGANTIVMAGGVGPCRFGYYAQVEREILEDLGYKLNMVVLEPPDKHLAQLLVQIKLLTGKNNWYQIIQAIRFAWLKVAAVDKLERQLHKLRPREVCKGQTEAVYRQGLDLVDKADSPRGIAKAVDLGMGKFARVKIDSQRECLKIGLVGEIYLLLDPFANMELEKRLGDMGVEVERSIYLSEWVNDHLLLGLVPGVPSSKAAKEQAKPYINHFLGGHGQDTIGNAIKFQQEGKDGIIHIAPLTCMPEIVAQSVFNRVREDRGMPTMTLIVDEQAGEAGLVTRLEAFVDLLGRRKAQKERSCQGERISGN